MSLSGTNDKIQSSDFSLEDNDEDILNFSRTSNSKNSKFTDEETEEQEFDQETEKKPTRLAPVSRFEDIQRETKEVLGFVDMFDGLQVSYTRGVSQNLHLVHSLSLGSQVDEQSYNFASNFVGERFFVTGRMDTNGVLMSRGIFNPISKLVLKSTIQLSPNAGQSAVIGEAEYRGSDFVAELKIGTPMIGASYCQRIWKGLSAGIEMAYTHMQGISVLRTAARYEGKSTVSTAQLDTSGQLNFAFVQKISESASLATELVVVASPKGWESITAVGYDYRLRTSNVRGMVDSHGRITAILEEKLNPAMSFLISGEVDYVRAQARFGIGFNMNL